MKKCYLLLILFSTIAFAQAPPQGISHRGTVYNTSGAIVVGNVGMEISILDNSASGTEVYKETFTVTTNSLGQYSLNIGQGTPASPWNSTSFSKINWGLNLKFLKIRIDPAGGTSYTITGSNQLMSVPYALYSLNSQVKVFNDITELRAATGILNEIAYLKGHTTAGDGGEGNFIWRDLPVGNAAFNDNNGIFVRNNSVAFGWVRIIEDRINVKYFGTNFTASAPDQGLLIQKAIDFANMNALNYDITTTKKFRDYTNSGSIVYIPSGTYKIMGKITLKFGVSIEGEGATNTILKADNSVQPNGSMIEIDGGQVRNLHVYGLFLDGNAAVGDPASTSTADCKNGIYIKARQQTPVDTFGGNGGLWSAKFQDISVRNFNGTGIIIEGNGMNSQVNAEDYAYPNQDLVFENVNVARQRDNSDCLLIRGQAGQLTFTNCGFDGLQTSALRASKWFNVAIETNGVQPAVIKFQTCTFQYAEYGVITTYAESITFDNCWFENLDNAVFAQKAATNSNKSQCINIVNSRFANASGFGTVAITNKNATGGTCIAVEGGSNVNVQNNYVCVSDSNYNNPNNYFIRNYGNDSKINTSNNSFMNPSLGKTLGVANKTVSIAGNTLTTFGYKYIAVNCLAASNTTNYIKQIISEISPGEMLTIKAVGTGQVKFDNSMHIVYPKTTAPTTGPFILNANETATFMKIDVPVGTLNETYQLISVNRTF